MKRIIKMIFALWPFYIIAAVVISLIWALSQKPAMIETHTPPPAKKEQTEKDKRLTRAIAGVIIMKKIVPVPENLKINKAIITEKGDVCYEFRFPNASGGISIQKVVLPVNGDSLLIPLSDGFTKAWNSKCASKIGEDVVDYLELAIKYATP